MGDKLDNPYVPTVMTEALQKVVSNGGVSLYPVNIRTTHYYVKFSPADWDEYDDLKLDSTLELSDVPYDHPIIQNGDYYHDPNVHDSLPTYQYASVPVDFDFNDTIQYEILSPLYIPEVDSTILGSNEENDLFIEKLLNEAYKITGNYDDTLDLSGQLVSKYTPGGNIQITDTRLNANYGMEGVKVRARRWFIMYIAHPDFAGNYRMKHKYRRKCNYAVFFETNRFNVKQRWHNILQNGVCWINGPKQYGDWSHTITNGFNRFAGHIFRAAYRYDHKDIGGLKRPISWPKRTYLAINSDHGLGWNPIVVPYIKIWRYENALEEYDSDEVFSTTTHETAHTTHSQRMILISYASVIGIVRESWAVGVEWFISHIEYVEKGIPNYGNENYYTGNTSPIYPNTYAYQYWAKGDLEDYTSVFINLIDNHNELNVTYPFWGTGVVDDLVTGYSLPFIESELLKNISGLSSLVTQLKNNKPAGVTDAQIDLLFTFY